MSHTCNNKNLVSIHVAIASVPNGKYMYPLLKWCIPMEVILYCSALVILRWLYRVVEARSIQEYTSKSIFRSTMVISHDRKSRILVHSPLYFSKNKNKPSFRHPALVDKIQWLKPIPGFGMRSEYGVPVSGWLTVEGEKAVPHAKI